MPEKEKPPAMRVDTYLCFKVNHAINRVNLPVLYLIKIRVQEYFLVNIDYFFAIMQNRSLMLGEFSELKIFMDVKPILFSILNNAVGEYMTMFSISFLHLSLEGLPHSLQIRKVLLAFKILYTSLNDCDKSLQKI